MRGASTHGNADGTGLLQPAFDGCTAQTPVNRCLDKVTGQLTRKIQFRVFFRCFLVLLGCRKFIFMC